MDKLAGNVVCQGTNVNFVTAQSEIHRHKSTGAKSPSTVANISQRFSNRICKQQLIGCAASASQQYLRGGSQRLVGCHLRVARGTLRCSAASTLDNLSSQVASSGMHRQTVGSCNQFGLNGLSACGLKGLQTGSFTVSAQQPIHYTIEETNDLFNINNMTLLRGVTPDSFPLRLAENVIPGQPVRRLIVMDSNVEMLYGRQIRRYLEHHGVECCILPLPTWEENKSFDLVFEIAQQIENFKINRRTDPIIAIGGGVCLDIAGLAANLYRRNTPVIKIPTTLMGVVDASIGIKTAVNFHDKKNKLGTYSAPLAVFIDLQFLKTLDSRNISNGAAEILKMASVKDDTLFNLLEEYGQELLATKFQCAVASVVIRRSIQGMLEELEPNLWEHILVRLVDYGHTFSPEIEMAALHSGNELLHGEAVNIDMALTTELSYHRGYITEGERERVFKIMGAFQLPVWHPVCSVKLLMKGLEDMARARDGLQRTPLMCSVGAARFVNDISAEEVAAALDSIQQWHLRLSCAQQGMELSPFVQNNAALFDHKLIAKDNNNATVAL